MEAREKDYSQRFHYRFTLFVRVLILKIKTLRVVTTLEGRRDTIDLFIFAAVKSLHRFDSMEDFSFVDEGGATS